MIVVEKVQNEKYLMRYFGNEAEVVYLGKSEIEELQQYLYYSSEKVGSTDEDMLLGLKLVCVDRETYLAVHYPSNKTRNFNVKPMLKDTFSV
jgi:hypothetical protein